MGCGQSKGASPQSEGVDDIDSKASKREDSQAKNAWQSADTPAAASTAASAAAAPQQRLAEALPAPPQEFASELTPRGQDLDLEPVPAAYTAPAKQPAAPDPEFDYTAELNAVTTAPTRASAGMLAAAGKPPSGKAGMLAPLNSGTTVGGLLSRQPDWLQDNKAPLPPVATYSNSLTGENPAKALSSSTYSSDNQSSSDRAGAGASALPSIGRGIGSAASKNDSSSLPPIHGAGLLQHSVTAASGDAGIIALPEPRRLTGNLSKGRGDNTANQIAGSSGRGDPYSSKAGAVRSSRNGAAAVDAAAGNWGDVAGSGAGAASLPAAVTADDDHEEPSAEAEEPDSSAAGGQTSSLQPSAAGTQQQTAAAANFDPSDPWSALQSQYVATAGPPSTDFSQTGENSSKLAGPGPSNLGKVAAAAGSAAGSRRSTNGAAALGLPTNKSGELVLVDSDEEAGYDDYPDDSSALQQQSAGILQDEQSHKFIAAARPAGLAAEPSRARVGGSKAAAGGWGDGNLAAAGTLMLGDEQSESQNSKKGVTAAQDDVFGDDDGENSPRGISLGKESSSRVVANSSRLVGENSMQQGGRAAATIEELGVEEIDDVDALIEAELAAKNALPGDLAAKLAQFEALAADDDGY